VKSGDIVSPNVGHASRAKRGKNVVVQKLLIRVYGSPFQLGLGMNPHEVPRDLLKRLNSAVGAALFDRIGAFFNSAQYDLGHPARLSRRQPTMSAERDAA
jgi:hypothetical protein